MAEQGWTDRRQAKSKRGPDTKEAEQGSQGKAARRSTGRSSDRTRHGRLGAGLGQISNAVFLSHYSWGSLKEDQPLPSTESRKCWLTAAREHCWALVGANDQGERGHALKALDVEGHEG